MRLKTEDYLVGLLVIFAVLSVVFYFIYKSKSSLKPVDIDIVQQPDTTEHASGFKILYGSAENNGRNLIYDNLPASLYNNTGVSTTWGDGVKGYDIIIGKIDSIEKTLDGQDLYLFISDPLTDSYLAQVRIMFSEKPDLLPPRLNTSLALEQLDLSAGTQKTYSMGKISKYFTLEEILKLVKINDSVVITTNVDFEADSKPYLDERGAYIASWLFLRRTSGIEALEQELGREIKLY